MGYRNLDLLGQELLGLGWLDDCLKLWILAEDYEQGDNPLGRYAIVFSHPIAGAGCDSEVYAHALFEWQWTSHHPSCWRDTLAVAMWYAWRRDWIETIPIRPIGQRALERLTQGELLPAEFFSLHVGGYDRLEDRVFPRGRFPRDEGLLAYMEQSGLSRYALTEASLLPGARHAKSAQC